jgi:lipoprotein-anchoring transpeptidase ErfK/SrfK
MSGWRRGIVWTIALVGISGCGDGDEPDIPPPPEAITTPTVGGGGSDTTGADEAGETTLVAQAKADSLGIWSSPTVDGPPDLTIRASDEVGGQIVLVVKQQLGSTWIETYLPTAPAGNSGWIKQEDITLSRHRFRIVVDRSDHLLTVHAGEVTALETPVSIGTTDGPAAGAEGLFIKDLIEIPEANGPYGRYVYGLAGSANRADRFAARAGVVGIHGTDDPASLGRDVPTGSLAIGDEALDRLVGSIGLPLGTPVEIVE